MHLTSPAKRAIDLIGQPDDLKRKVAGDSVVLSFEQQRSTLVVAELVSRLDGASNPAIDGNEVRFQVPDGASALPVLLRAMVEHDLDATGVEVLLSVVAVAFFRLDAPIESLIVVVAVIGLLGGAFSALSYGAALKLKSEDSFAPVINGLILPVLLLSGILLPMTLAPGWLQTVADVNPLTHIVDGVRAVYRGELGSSEALSSTAP